MGNVHGLATSGSRPVISTSGKTYATRSSATRSPTTATTQRLFLKMDGHHHRLSRAPRRQPRTSTSSGGRSAPPTTCTRWPGSSRRAGVAVIGGEARGGGRPARRRLRALRRAQQPGAHGAALRARGRVHAAVPPAAPDHRLQDRRAGPGPLRDLRARSERGRRVLRAGAGFGVSDWILSRAWAGSARSCTATRATTRWRSSPIPQPRKKIHHIMMEYTVDRRRGHGLRPLPAARPRDRDAGPAPERPHALVLLQEPGRLALRDRLGCARDRPRDVAGRALQRPAARRWRMGPRRPLDRHVQRPAARRRRPTKESTTC